MPSISLSQESPLEIVRMLWIGSQIGQFEKLSMRSFLACGHAVELFTYNDIPSIPKGVKVKDANTILSESSVFRHKASASVAPFADWFRYKLLYEKGGIWADTDMICLKPIDIDRPLYFGKEAFGRVNNALIKAQAGHSLLKWMADQAQKPNCFLPYDSRKTKRRKMKRRLLQGNLKGRVDWGECGPNGLTKAVNYFGLESAALPYHYFYPVHFSRWDSLFDENADCTMELMKNSYCVHLWNNMFRLDPHFDKEAIFPKNSVIEQLKNRFLKDPITKETTKR